MNIINGAVVDTSFWSLCCLTGLEPYLWVRWSVLFVPTIVQQELFHQNRLVPQQQLFQQALHMGHIQIQDPGTLISTLSKGEQAVVSLAQEKQIPALLDDYRPHQHAQKLGINVISVAQFLIWLLYRGTLSVTQAEQHFQQLQQTHATSQFFLQWAARHIQQKGGQVTWP